jgi:hypothetical protein
LLKLLRIEGLNSIGKCLVRVSVHFDDKPVSAYGDSSA